MIKTLSSGVELVIRVIPRARKTTVAGVRGGAILVRLSAPPLGGAANEALVEFIAGQLGIARRAVRIVSGETSRLKRVAADGVSEADVRRALALP